MNVKTLLPGIILLILACIISLCTYKQYGIAWDEPTQREIGYVSYNYAFKGDTTLNSFFGKYHGVGYELPLVMLEKETGLTDPRDIYLQRHLVSHLFFLFAAFCGYILFIRLFKNPVIASIGFLMLVFHPRIYVHSFINSKDLPFLSLIVIAMLLAHIAFEKRRVWLFALLGIICGYATSIRILGVLPLAIITCLLLADIVSAICKKRPVICTIIHLATFFTIFWLVLYAAWPLLWQAPVTRFAEAMATFSKYIWDGHMLFMGGQVHSINLPWTYLPVWFAITTPVLWLVLGISGTLWMIINIAKKPVTYLTHTPERNYLLYLGLLFIPVLMVIVLNAVVYDDWRHVYFIYPAFIIMALYVVHRLWNTRARYPILLLCLAQFMQAGVFMYQSFPLQHLFFNQLVPKTNEYLRNNYEYDYWGLSFRQGLEYLDATIPGNTPIRIRVITEPTEIRPVFFNTYMLPEAKRKRFEFTIWDEEAEYMLVNYRFHPADYNIGKPVYHVKLMNSTVMTVIKLHPER